MTSDLEAKADVRHPALWGIYLNDHLAAMTAGLELAYRAFRAERDPGLRAILADAAADMEDQRTALLRVMDRTGVPVRRYKVFLARAAERVGRFKPNGHLRQRSPLSGLVEAEGLRAAVEMNFACWRTIRDVSTHDPRLDGEQVDLVLGRAEHQVCALEQYRIRTAADVFGARSGA